jgi:adenylylsulfate kinase
LPSSGKSTLAAEVRKRLLAKDHACCLLDGDAVRKSLRPKPGYSPAERDEFYATLGSLAALLARQGLVVLVAATAHRRAYRDDARAAAPRFLEVYVRTPLEECERRDAKGLFARARAGELEQFPGVNVAYEEAVSPDVVAEGGLSKDAVDEIVKAIEHTLVEESRDDG